MEGMMQHAYGRYEAVAFGADETNTLSGEGVDNWGGLSLTMVDALDTLALMGMRAEFDRAVDWLHQHYREAHSKNLSVNTFESTIRILGGYLGGWTLAVPDSRQRAMLAEMAEDIGLRLVKAFYPHANNRERKTPHLPYSDINLATGGGALLAGYVSLSEANVGLDLRAATLVTGNPVFAEAAANVRVLLRTHYNVDAGGLLPVLLPLVPQGMDDFKDIPGNKLGLGARGDSYYEYLLKEWILGGKSDSSLLRSWQNSMYKIYHNVNSHAEVDGVGQDRIADFELYRSVPKMDHLTCFLPGTLALDYIVRKDYNESDSYTPSRRERWRTSTAFEDLLVSTGGTLSIAQELDWAKNLTSACIGIPEAIEALWYMWRATGDWYYREAGWRMARALERHARTPYGYSSLGNVRKSGSCTGWQPTYFFSETLKYLYLLFSPDSIGESPGVQDGILLHHSVYVLNTEGHPYAIPT
ncbi:Endoplasmic reticulum mannosyl-oligosaccharide 1,2-alpha-mannosidase [Perkinsus olseni]|uniref:alpha-1,2-Mannosidase n=1 Tax=Perkinsus olseni TaxID=32597 RepID=A0A7J6NUT2_PEROL|nr:Endoplasmic reticulum mannosyl-oligosaccharide 1,2-alpha-mannosidase [Perkinsus olseni]